MRAPSAFAIVMLLLLAAAEANAPVLAGAALGHGYQAAGSTDSPFHRGVSSTIVRYGGGLQPRF
jgi:hypothetical protein